MACASALDPAADEIIIVDDASTDDTPTILAELSLSCPALRTIRLDKRSGAAVARNRGLEAARGRYLAFVDADDFFQADRFREALAAAEQDQLDMVFLNATFHYEGRKAEHPLFRQPHPDDVMTGGSWLKSLLPVEAFHHAVWLHLYRCEWLRNTGLRFPIGNANEDVIWTTEVLLRARRMRYLPDTGYFYRIPQRAFDQTEIQTRLEFVIRSSVANAKRLSELAAAEPDPELRELLTAQLVDGALQIFHKLKKMPDRCKARNQLAELRKTGFLAFLWRHARQWSAKRRILRNWLLSWA
jgi:heptose III glucuronosyltransferase